MLFTVLLICLLSCLTVLLICFLTYLADFFYAII
jgi:hypothetical protein